EVTEMLEAGLVDAVQMHGDETPDDCARLWPDYYKAVRPAGIDDIAAAGAFRCPRTLIDACADAPGGTGKTVSEPVLAAWKKPLWLAGGVTPDAIDTVVMRWRPELVDLASGIESEPGIKDSGAMRKLFQRLDAVKDVPIKEGE
ncbi:MAG: bifunctional indole-3-glycerol phosphate synthase/phosphoribosylanthranilate isomerase, partial [Planctomycetes bacterium]|nr:bifunctional indole-3-glycerol phosphate synthase/phosphoribosylanthranilate isomerase [Planctomycetota bacterium]